ncbi:DUF885 family protein [Kangiella sp. TOML190]|uniref:DUF885 domain-containing protein n=1 Tax=Kangiella sp. TOML190 TaxID=2931351 RepID=UPI00203E93B9|nr:DUF885 domain-containing protein [Kangiella sp. TOML190]
MNKKTIAMAVTAALTLVACEQEASQPQQPVQVVETQEVKVVDEATVKAQQDEKQQLDKLKDIFQKTTVALLKARPLSATAFGVSEADAGGYFNDRIARFSPEAEAELRTELAEYAKQLKGMKFSDAKVDENRQVMASIARYYSGEPSFDIGYIDSWMGQSAFVVNQINGPAIDVPNMLANNHPIKTVKDAEDYLARLAQFDEVIASVNQKVIADAEKGWIPPKVVIGGALKFLKGFTKAAPEEHSLVSSFSSKVEQLAMDADQKTKLLAKANQLMAEVVYPAYQNLAKTMQSLSDKATTESGIWAQPNGAAYYAEAVRQLGDTDMSPEEIHEVGLAEVARITTEMDAILTANGYEDGSVGARMAQLNDEPRFLYEDSDAGRQQLLDDLNAQIEEINERMPEQFATKPPYDVEVRRIPVERQEGAPGGQYTNPSLDGSQPGIYWINLRDMKANPKFDLKTLTYHEANPGHHWQIALNMAQDDLPLLRRLAPYNAYVEGWALYSELVAWEMGMYENDPFGDLGRLKAELFRAVRLVVDTGLHAKKWSREEAIQYMAETTGTAQSDVVAEIERYMTWPGQALGYKLGMINLVNQRAKARKALGDKFDPKEFHDLILLGGAVPMAVLNAKIDKWIASKSK